MEKQLSIIIPTYNMEEYLPRCLESLVIPDSLEALDIWVVNDGSKDKSSEIAHAYADRYPDVFNVLDKPNGHYGSCINAALPECRGRYIKILDSDDYVDTQELAKLVSRLPETDVDIVVTDYTSLWGDKKVLNKADYPANQIVAVAQEGKIQQIHSLLYKRQLLYAINYRQTDGIAYTDVEWDMIPMLHAKTLLYLEYNVTQYFLCRPGQSVDPKVMFWTYKEQLLLGKRLLLYYINLPKDQLSEKVKGNAMTLIMNLFIHVYRYFLVLAEKAELEKVEELDSYLKETNEALYNELSVLNTSIIGKRLAFALYFNYWKAFHKRLPQWLRALYIRFRF